MSDYKSTPGTIKDFERAFIDDCVSHSLIPVSCYNADALEAEVNLTMFEILDLQQYDNVPTNFEHPMPLT